MSSNLLSRRFDKGITLKIETIGIKHINTSELPSPVYRRTPPTSRKSTKTRPVESIDTTNYLNK